MEVETETRKRSRSSRDVQKSRKKRRLKKKHQVEEEEKKRLARQTRILDYSSSGDDSFIVYDGEDVLDMESSEDSLDVVSANLRRVIGILPGDVMDDARNLFEMSSEGDEEEPRRLREGLGQEVSDDEPQAAEVRAHSKRFLDWRRNIKARDRKRGLGFPTKTDPKDLVCPEIGLLTAPFFHQTLGVAWCMMREEIPYRGLRGGILADDMGAGKTLQMLMLVAMDKICGYAHDSNTDKLYRPPTLVVCPAMLTASWEQEAKTHFGHEYMQTLVLNSSTQKRWSDNIKSSQFLDADVVIVSYAGLRNVFSKMQEELRSQMRANPRDYVRYLGDIDPDDIKTFHNRVKQVTEDLDVGFATLWRNPDKWTAKHFLFGYPWRRVIFDECTHFKNDSTLTYESVNCIAAERKWSLSGTPLENHPDELYSQLNVLGIAQRTSFIREKSQWREFINRDEFGCEIKTSEGRATPHAVKRLKREFLNVLVLRREIQTISLIDPLSPYVQRANASEDTAEAWMSFAQDYFSHKSGGGATRRPLASDDDDDDDDDDEEEEEEEEESGDSARDTANDPPQFPQIPGFYWEADQERFTHSYRRAKEWLFQGTGLKLEELAATVRRGREKMQALKLTQVPGDGKDKERSEIFGIDIQFPNGEPLQVWAGFAIPKPLLLLGRMHNLEKAVYEHLTTKSKTDLASTESSVQQQKLAFLAVVNCRFASADYRFPLTAPKFLDEKYGTKLWGNTVADATQFFLMDPKTRTQLAKEERENLTEVGGEDMAQAGISKNSASDKRSYRVPNKAPTKYCILERYIRAVPKDDKILVFSDMVRFFPKLREYLEKRNIRCAVLHGRMGNAERDRELALFRDKGPKGAKVFLLSLMLAKQGLNLQEANHVILYNQWWNPSVESQAERRVARPGQKKQVYFVRVALLDTIDEIVITRAGIKTEMIKDMIGTDDGLISTGANFSRPEENRGLFVDTDKDPPENESLKDIEQLPLVDFSPDEEGMEKISRIHNPDGRINKRFLADVVMENARKQTWRFVDETPHPVV